MSLTSTHPNPTGIVSVLHWKTRLSIPCFVAALCLGLTACSDSKGAMGSEPIQESSLERSFIVPGAQPGNGNTFSACPGRARREFRLPAKVEFNAERSAHVLTRFTGVVSMVHAALGQDVVAGAPLAQLESRELTEARIAYVEAQHDLEFCGIALEREERLWEKDVTSEVELQAARFEEHEARLKVFSTRETLLALGADPEELAGLHGEDLCDSDGNALGLLAKADITSPLGGRVVDKHAVMGEAVEAGTLLFQIADMSNLWIDARVPSAIAARVSIGDEVHIVEGELGLEIAASIAYIDAKVDPGTQTTLMRAIVEGPGSGLSPGLFVEMVGSIPSDEAPIVVPKAAIQQADGRDWVFVHLQQDQWDARPVEVGFLGDEFAVVRSGLESGERVAVTGTVAIKAVWLGYGGEDA